MRDHYEIRFSGSGGQGLMLLGDIFAQAAGAEDKEILLTKSYGPESRGGACRSELIVDSDPINYPAMSAPDFVLSMSQLSCNSYTGDMKPGGKLLIDAGLVKELPKKANVNVYPIPLTRLAEETTGKAIAANVVAIGAITVLSGLVSEDAVQAALEERFAPKFHESNRKAFQAGADAARELMGLRVAC